MKTEISKYMAMIGTKGGKAGKGKAKARTRAQAQKASRIRWANFRRLKKQKGLK